MCALLCTAQADAAIAVWVAKLAFNSISSGYNRSWARIKGSSRLRSIAPLSEIKTDQKRSADRKTRPDPSNFDASKTMTPVRQHRRVS